MPASHSGRSRFFGARASIIAAIGCTAVIALVWYQGASLVFAALAVAGWRLWLVPLFHLVPLFIYGLAWQAVFIRTWSSSLWVFQRAAWLREAGNTLLPLPQIGGEVLGARLLTFAGAAPSVAVGSIVVDLTLVVASQCVLTLLAIVLLIGSGHFESPVHGLALAIILCLPFVFGFYLAQRYGLFAYVERRLGQAAVKWPDWGLTRLAGMHELIQQLYSNRRSVLLSGLLHLASWLLTSAEVWLTLRLMGFAVTLGQATVIYGLGAAVRSSAVLIPAGLGAQEVSFMFLAGLYGFPPAAGLAVSFAIRFREIVIGGPALLCWSLLESRRTLDRP
jgi:glycosyltransferase 2 family protein